MKIFARILNFQEIHSTSLLFFFYSQLILFASTTYTITSRIPKITIPMVALKSIIDKNSKSPV